METVYQNLTCIIRECSLKVESDSIVLKKKEKKKNWSQKSSKEMKKEKLHCGLGYCKNDPLSYEHFLF